MKKQFWQNQVQNRPYVLILFSSIIFFHSMRTEAFEKRQLHAGYHTDQYMVAKEVLLVDEQMQRHLEKIILRIANAASIKEQFTVRILNTQDINAYATLGGFIYITTGLLDMLESEDQLAAVISHEMVHIVNHDFVKKWNFKHEGIDKTVRITSAFGAIVGTGVGLVVGINLGGSASSSIAKVISEKILNKVITGLASRTAATVATLITAAGAITVLHMVNNGYSQQHELEADKIAVKFLQSAKYEPRAMIAFFKNLKYFEAKYKEVDEDRYVSKIFNASPGLSERIERLESLIPTSNK